MRNLYAAGIILKILIFVVFFFRDVAISTSGDNLMHEVSLSEKIQPIHHNTSNELSYLNDFEHLESGIAFLLGKFDIKGASVAVAKDGRLVYAKGIGFANVEANEPVEPKHLFRIASVSKLITATTIMKMTELDMLSIDDKVFGKDGILNDSVYLSYADPRVEEITVRHLLNHSAGWNRRYGDPMIQHHLIAREMNVDMSVVKMPDILRYALNHPLHFDPGSGTSYSNLGYAVLGEVIEGITGMTYETYVREEILSPLGIREMKIGKNLLEDSYENEVKHYDLKDDQRFSPLNNNNQVVPLAYGGNNIETLGAAGGWIASPVEILKLVVSIDSANYGPNFLSTESIELMTDAGLSGGQTIGWAGTDGRGNWWRTGSLAGTSALVMRQKDGVSWVVLLNSSSYRGNNLASEINKEMKAAFNKLEQWPNHDLFYYFDIPPLLYPDIAQLL